MSEADITGRLARYMASAREQRLAPNVVREARHRILDALAAMVSGSVSSPERWRSATRARRAASRKHHCRHRYHDLRRQRRSVNGMFAHADETDDFEP
jgi:2-methylcitrate dehydratase PrpD